MEPKFVLVALIVIAALAWGVHYEMRRRTALQIYWGRKCQGKEWKEAFPESTAAEIRAFLLLFVDCFGFGAKKILSFAPSDRLLAIYRASNPDKSAPDILEIETLALRLNEIYAMDLASIWNDDVTLGEVYEHSQHAA